MLLAIIRFIYVFVCTGAIAAFSFRSLAERPVEGAEFRDPSWQIERVPDFVGEHPFATFLILESMALSVLVVDLLIPRKRVDVVSAIYFGLLVGVLLSYLLMRALDPLFASRDLFGDEGAAWQAITTLMATLILAYICIAFLLQTKDDFRFVIPYVEFSRDLKGGRPLIVDSSALIDGRIADLVDTNILDAEVTVPQFVLQEVQDIADASDKVRRSRGRRGLDILKRLQQHPKIDVRVQETEPLGKHQKHRAADQRIIELAKQVNGRIVTSDFNLNKVASVQGLQVVNLNDVANSLKPRFIPGEELRLTIIKEGESQGQGVGYLDDGTMVVCENSASEVGREIDVVVTSVLQNSAGRMIFGRPITPEDIPATVRPKLTVRTSEDADEPAPVKQAN